MKKGYLESRTPTPCVRMAGHRSNTASIRRKQKYIIYIYISIYSLFDEFGLDTRKVALVEDFPCSNKKELVAFGRKTY